MESLLNSDKQVVIISTMEDLVKVMKIVHEEIQMNQKVSKDDNTEAEELLTIAQFSKLFQISETTAHKWKNEGLIPYIRIKSRIRFKKSEILKLFEKRRLKKG